MKTTRREFIKLGAGAISITFIIPDYGFGGRAVAPAAADRRILVVVQLTGGNDGLNTVIPYADPRYHSMRPALGFGEQDLRDQTGNPTIINEQLGFHPALKGFKQLYDAGKLAVVLGVGYPNSDQSHGTSLAIWQTGDITGSARLGWLGRFADRTFGGKGGFSAVAVGTSYLPIAAFSATADIPLVAGLGQSTFRVAYVPERGLIVDTFRSVNQRDFPPNSFVGTIAGIGAGAERNSGLLENAAKLYQSNVQYPDDNPAAQVLKSVMVLATAFPEASIFHVNYSCFFDTHAAQIGTPADQFRDKRAGAHATDLGRLSEAVQLFTEDADQQGLGDNIVLMTYSDFGRRPNENASAGTDHGTASNLFVVGNKVKGGLYGMQPSLAASGLDADGNLRFSTDFRSVYATVLDNWLQGAGSQDVLGGRFSNIGFV
jgi:uncharacterized protein (DUF1501 family)